MEVEGLGEQSWRHAGKEAEDHKGGEISKRHCAADNRESLEIGGGPVVPRNEAKRSAKPGIWGKTTYATVPGM
jgi:hypothetical protein